MEKTDNYVNQQQNKWIYNQVLKCIYILNLEAYQIEDMGGLHEQYIYIYQLQINLIIRDHTPNGINHPMSPTQLTS